MTAQENKPPKVSIVCAWYNRADYIRDTVDSLLAQHFDSFEVIIVNDGSPDARVASILNSYDDKRLRIIHQENRGFTHAISHAIAISRAPYIAIQGAGDVSHKDRIKRQYTLMEERPEISATGTGYRQVTPGASIAEYYVPPDPFCDERTLARKMPFTHGTTMYRRFQYNASGGYDLRFKYCSDWDLFFRIVAQGPIVGINAPLYERRAFFDGITFAPDKKFQQIWFNERARDRSSERNVLLDQADVHISNIRPEDPRNMRISARYFLGSAKRADIKNVRAWGQLIRKQFIVWLKGKTYS